MCYCFIHTSLYTGLSHGPILALEDVNISFYLSSFFQSREHLYLLVKTSLLNQIYMPSKNVLP